MYYFDFNATTPVDPEVLEAMLPWLKEDFGNPSSPYPPGLRAAEALENAREAVGALIGAEPGEILFTSCGTESITSAILSCVAQDPDRKHIITSAVEHSATLKLCEHLAQRGYEITYLPVNREGQIDTDQLAAGITEETALISLLWGNNETGVVFPVDRIAAIALEKGVPLHIDAVQAAGKIPIDLKEIPIPLLSLSGHKLYCPKGIGALRISRRVRFSPLLRGSQEQGRRGGTQNVASIAAFGKAAEIAAAGLPASCGAMTRLRDLLEREIIESVPGVRLNGARDSRLPNTSNLAFDGVDGEALLILLSQKGVYCSAGSACTSGSVSPSHVLRAMGRSTAEARSSLRFSLGRTTTEADVRFCAGAVAQAVDKLRSMRQAGPVAIAQ